MLCKAGHYTSWSHYLHYRYSTGYTSFTCVHLIGIPLNVLISLEVDTMRKLNFGDTLTPRIIQSDSVCINNTQFKNVCTVILIWLPVSKSSMQQLSKEAVSTLFSVQEDEAESDSDFSMDSSLDSDPQDQGIYTSTPIKLNRTTNLGSDASSPASFSGPSFSLIEDLIDVSELPSLHESINEMTGTQSSYDLPSQQQNNCNSNNSVQPQQISSHCS